MNDIRIAIIGLGYVGLPLAVEFSKVMATVGFDINKSRIAALQSGMDSTLEISEAEMQALDNILFTSDVNDISECNIYIVTVPTPIDDSKQPDLTPLVKASETVAGVISKGDIVIYESTVYPGVTEEVCVPIIENITGFVFNKDFFAGYSPERINPGDKEHRLPSIKKVTSGSTPEIANFIDELYKKIITAGTHQAPSIKVAEAAKVIENTQRDLNIALINELAIIFNKLNIDTSAVLEAAGTKWNFLPFKPGLVGGHCIGVDPYYLTYKAQSIGYHPEVILAGRRINDGMASYLASEIVKLMIKKDQNVSQRKILVMGLAFKENCPDLRNTKVVDVINELKSYGLMVDVYDPWVCSKEAMSAYGLDMVKTPEKDTYSAIVLAVAHDDFIKLGAQGIHKYGNKNHILYDVKAILPKNEVDGKL